MLILPARRRNASHSLIQCEKTLEESREEIARLREANTSRPRQTHDYDIINRPNNDSGQVDSGGDPFVDENTFFSIASVVDDRRT